MEWTRRLLGQYSSGTDHVWLLLRLPSLSQWQFMGTGDATRSKLWGKVLACCLSRRSSWYGTFKILLNEKHAAMIVMSQVRSF